MITHKIDLEDHDDYPMLFKDSAPLAGAAATTRTADFAALGKPRAGNTKPDLT